MKKSEFISAVAARTGLALTITEQTVDAMVETLAEVLIQHDSFMLPGFGTVGVKSRAARTDRHPQTGKTFEIPITTVAYLKPSSVLKAKLNPKPAAASEPAVKKSATKKQATAQ